MLFNAAMHACKKKKSKRYHWAYRARSIPFLFDIVDFKQKCIVIFLGGPYR